MKNLEKLALTTCIGIGLVVRNDLGESPKAPPGEAGNPCLAKRE